MNSWKDYSILRLVWKKQDSPFHSCSLINIKIWNILNLFIFFFYICKSKKVIEFAKNKCKFGTLDNNLAIFWQFYYLFDRITYHLNFPSPGHPRWFKKIFFFVLKQRKMISIYVGNWVKKIWNIVLNFEFSNTLRF